jgi:hypothetical protein
MNIEPLEILSATDGPWETLGEYIRASGQDDASGSRRYYAAMLARRDFSEAAKRLKIKVEDTQALRQRFVAVYGEAKGAAA